MRFAELVQQLPASEYHHHAHPGGLLDHSLEVAAFAAKLRQRHLLPAGAAPEDQAREAEAWTAGIIYAALLHDVGKIATDMEIITLKLSPVIPRPIETTTLDHLAGKTRPLQIRIDPLLHRDIKIAATEQGKSITAFLLECYHYWRRMNK